uniref:Ig-like domain-containing protein n=1 Tax=Latimeria chalumnae TaxID=7897 RepID=H3A1M1_LATCH
NITQLPGSLTAKEGEETTLNCSNSSPLATGDSLQWYYQPFNGAPSYFIQSYKTLSGSEEKKAEGVEDRFSVSLDASNKVSTLTIREVQMADSGLYHCALKPTQFLLSSLDLVVNLKKLKKYLTILVIGLTLEDSVSHMSKSVVEEESQAVTITCSYNTSYSNLYLQWYRQFKQEAPIYLLQKYFLGIGTVQGDKAEGIDDRFEGFLDPKTKVTNLTIKDLKLSDTAMYYCALS